MTEPVLATENLKVSYASRRTGFFSPAPSPIQAVRGISLEIKQGEVLGLVGESGCGKSTLAKALLGLTPISAGRVSLLGEAFESAGRAPSKALRRKISMIFQDPYASLNPRLSAESIIGEPLAIHKIGNRQSRKERVRQLAEAVGIDSGLLSRPPHQFSGGQRQRIAIARALASNPSLIIADEPTSALDVSIQSQILNLLTDLRQQLGLSLLFISHDLGIVRYMADRIAVMYCGEIVETAPTAALFEAPAHPYSRALIAASPALGVARQERSGLLAGDPPSPLNPPAGCAFHNRCPWAQDQCRESSPTLTGGDHRVACHRAGEIEP